MKIVSIYPCPLDSQIRHDYSVTVYNNNKIYSYEEAKISTLKNDGYAIFPERALFAGLKQLKLNTDEIDLWLFPIPSKKYKLDNLYLYFSHLLKAFSGNKDHFKIWLKKKVKFISHHDSHVGISLGASGFENSAYLSMDGGGDYGDPRHTLWGKYEKNKFINFGSLSGLNNLAGFHAFITDFCMFGSENGKVNGLAAYGNPDPNLEKKISKYIRTTKNGITFIRKRFEKTRPDINKFKMDGYSRSFLNRQPYKTNIFNLCSGYLIEDVAATGEKVLQKYTLDLVRKIKKKTKLDNIVFSGGVFNNVKLNQIIQESRIFKNNFFSMSPSDAGLSLGALFYFLKIKKKKIHSLKYGITPYLGPSFSDKECLKEILNFKLIYSKKENYIQNAAKNIKKGKIVGFFEGRAEYGPRSLGSRSILADPRNPKSKQKINLLLKKRDWFMPFAPSVLIEKFDKWFYGQKSYYMQISNKVNEKIQYKIPSAVHVDGTSRVQCVEKKLNKNYWNLINEFFKITSVPMLLNTSFNRHGIATISTPRQAIEHLLEGCMDILYLEGYEIKYENNRKSLKKLFRSENENKLLKKLNKNWIDKNKKKLNKLARQKFNLFFKKKFK